MKTSELLKAPGVAWVLFLYTYTMLLALGYTAGMQCSSITDFPV